MTLKSAFANLEYLANNALLTKADRCETDQSLRLIAEALQVYERMMRSRRGTALIQPDKEPELPLENNDEVKN